MNNCLAWESRRLWIGAGTAGTFEKGEKRAAAAAAPKSMKLIIYDLIRIGVDVIRTAFVDGVVAVYDPCLAERGESV